jgi:hypothetical protein
MAAKVQGLFECDPEGRLVVGRAEKQSVDLAIGFAQDDVLDAQQGFCHGTVPRFNYSMNRSVIA